MSKGEILQHIGEGKYRVRQFLAYDRIQQEIDRLNDRIAELAVDIPETKLEKIEKEGQISQVKGDLHSWIDLYQQEPDTYRANLIESQRALIRLGAELRIIDLKLARLIAENLAALKRRGQLNAAPKDRELEAWCADYTEDLSGEVGLVDVNDEGGIVPIVQPGFGENAAYQKPRDGALFPNIAQSAAQIYFNAAIMPGVQKWQPRYRVGEIVIIENDICTVNLEEAKSSIQDLEINQLPTLSDIPIQYMDCNGDAFEVGDRVLVRYFLEGPQVVGFANNPRPCSVDMLWKSIQRQSSSNQYDVQRRARIGRNDPDINVFMGGGAAVSLYDDVEWYQLLGNIYRGNDFFAEVPSSWNGAANDLRVFDNAAAGQKEIWISGIDGNDNAVVARYSEGGQLIETTLLELAATASGYVFLSTSPHYYIFGTNSGISVREIESGNLVISGSWCTDFPHAQSGLIDITDELAVWACKESVVCRTLPDGLSITVPVDYQYLEYTVTSLQFDFTRGIQAVQLTNNTLTVFGSTRYIHYRVTRNENGKPNGFAEISRYQYADFENYNLYASSDRSKIRAIPPA